MFGFWYYPEENEANEFATIELQRLEDKLTTIIEKDDYDEIIFGRLQLNIKAIKYYYGIKEIDIK